MKLVRDRTDTWWAPARFHHAMFRLAALVVAGRLREEPRPGVVRIIDSHQNPVESYAIAIWQLLTLACYFTALLAPTLGVAFGAVLSLLLATIAVHVIVVGFGILAGVIVGNRNVDRTGIVTRLSMTLLAALSAWISTTRSWVRWVGLAFLFVLILNAVSFALMRVLRSQVERVNRERGVPQ